MPLLLVLLSLGGLSLPRAQAANPIAAVTERLLTTQVEGGIARRVMEETPTGRQLLQVLGGGEIRSVEEGLARLRQDNLTRFAEVWNDRLSWIETEYARTLKVNPAADIDALLAKLAEAALTVEGFTAARSLKELRFTRLVEATTSVAIRANFLGEAGLILADRSVLLQAIETAALEKPALKLVETREAYERLIRRLPALETPLKEAHVLRVLADLENEELALRLGRVLKNFEWRSQGSLRQRLSQALRLELQGKVPAHQISERIDALFSASEVAYPRALRRALGDMNLQEVQLHFHGGKPLQPTADSLVGRYLHESGAATTVRSFSLGPEKPGQVGPERLVVAVSESSLPAFLKYFGGAEGFTVFGHALMVHEGRVVSYHHAGTPFRMPKLDHDNILPWVLLKSSEGRRLRQYLDLNARGAGTGYYDVAKEPWSHLPNYCSMPGYWRQNCTHWIGNMPIGDERVLSYRFPSAQSGVAIQAELRPFESGDPLVKRVWKSPGNKQFGELVGLGEQNIDSELANPGWVMVSLSGPASVERVPVVFHLVHDHRAPISPDFVVRHEHPQ